MSTDALRIERREYKYLLSEAQVARVRDAIRPFCAMDPYAAAAPGHRYTIESLYFDTPDLALYRANDLELVDRFKLRVRRYPDAPKSPYFLEVKSRYHDTIIKSRGKVGANWAELTRDPFVSRKALGTGTAAERFVTRLHTIGARPTVVVRYSREAWASVVDDYARVTFDTRVTGQLCDPDGWHFELDPTRFRACDDATGVREDETRTILELKFTTHAPRWMMSLVERMNLMRRAYSKYGRALEATLIPEEIRTPTRSWVAARAMAREGSGRGDVGRGDLGRGDVGRRDVSRGGM